MREYEFTYIIQPDATPEREKEIHSRLDDAVAKGGGTVLLRDDWGKRKLAYEIRKFQKGHYVLLSYLGDGGIVEEAERLVRLDPDILRFLSVKVADEVKDVEDRIAKARKEEAERAQRREERDRLEAERAAARQEVADAAQAQAAAQAEAAAKAEAAAASESEEGKGAEDAVEKPQESGGTPDSTPSEDKD